VKVERWSHAHPRRTGPTVPGMIWLAGGSVIPAVPLRRVGPAALVFSLVGEGPPIRWWRASSSSPPVLVIPGREPDQGAAPGWLRELAGAARRWRCTAAHPPHRCRSPGAHPVATGQDGPDLCSSSGGDLRCMPGQRFPAGPSMRGRRPGRGRAARGGRGGRLDPAASIVDPAEVFIAHRVPVVPVLACGARLRSRRSTGRGTPRGRVSVAELADPGHPPDGAGARRADTPPPRSAGCSSGVPAAWSTPAGLAAGEAVDAPGSGPGTSADALQWRNVIPLLAVMCSTLS